MKKSFPFAWNQPEGTLLYTDFLFKTHVEKYQEVLSPNQIAEMFDQQCL